MPYKNREDQRKCWREWYYRNKKYCIDSKTKRRLMIRKFIDDYKKENKCLVCGESEPCCLDFHHYNAEHKELGIGMALVAGWGIERIKLEMDKCIILCSNCHRKLHAGIVSIKHSWSVA